MKPQPLQGNIPIVQQGGGPSTFMTVQWQNLLATIDGLVIAEEGAAWGAATGSEDRTALASYPGQVVSNPPTQAEMQALDDAVKLISEHLVALINDLRANGALNN